MRLFRIYKCDFIVVFDQHAVVNQEIQMRLFVLAALVYVKSLKKIKNFKTSSILCEGNVDEEWHGSVSNDVANQKTHKNPQRQ